MIETRHEQRRRFGISGETKVVIVERGGFVDRSRRSGPVDRHRGEKEKRVGETSIVELVDDTMSFSSVEVLGDVSL